MHADLQQACYSALVVPRHEARSRALDFTWAHSAQLFARYLVPVRQISGCQQLHGGATCVKDNVTAVSSNS
jgi:hypothetical protein